MDISLKDVTKGRRVAAGSYGEVFEGKYKNERVILKMFKGNTGGAGSFFDAEAKINRRLKNNPAVASFQGVAGDGVYLVWKYEGLDTLDTILTSRDPQAALANAMGKPEGKPAVAQLMKGLVKAVGKLHGAGVIHRDIKPGNILLAESKGGMFGGGARVVKMLDLGGCADLRTGVNYSEDETVFDPIYGPPEKYLTGSFGGLFGGLAWGTEKPDLFDAFSLGMVLMQVAVPGLSKSRGMVQKFRGQVERRGYALEEWRDFLTEREEQNFGFDILDADNGAGWDLAKKLIAPRKKRASVGSIQLHRFLR